MGVGDYFDLCDFGAGFVHPYFWLVGFGVFAVFCGQCGHYQSGLFMVSKLLKRYTAPVILRVSMLLMSVGGVLMLLLEPMGGAWFLS